jgi:hypothetical protein
MSLQTLLAAPNAAQRSPWRSRALPSIWGEKGRHVHRTSPSSSAAAACTKTTEHETTPRPSLNPPSDPFSGLAFRPKSTVTRSGTQRLYRGLTEGSNSRGFS